MFGIGSSRMMTAPTQSRIAASRGQVKSPEEILRIDRPTEFKNTEKRWRVQP
jgi:hypothetical protein